MAEPRLIADGTLQRCSICGYPFPADVKPSMSVAFADHLRKSHQSEISESMKQDANFERDKPQN